MTIYAPFELRPRRAGPEVRNGCICIGSFGPLRGRRVLQLRPDGLWAIDWSGRTTSLPWDAYGSGWQFATLERSVASLTIGEASHSVRVPQGRWSPLPTLFAHLARHPELRPGLADPAVIGRLVTDLRSWHPDPFPPGEPLSLGARLAEWHVIGEVLDAELERYERRHVAGDVLPDVEGVVQRVAERLGHDPDLDALTARVRRHLDVSPWPFAALRGG